MLVYSVSQKSKQPIFVVILSTDFKILLMLHSAANHCSRKRMKHGKKRKKSRFLDFEKNVKNVKNVEVITCRSIGLKTTVTILNQFCCSSRNLICGGLF